MTDVQLLTTLGALFVLFSVEVNSRFLIGVLLLGVALGLKACS